jgi:Carboxypeptidase regulatory-like domain/TonB dependent receptor
MPSTFVRAKRFLRFLRPSCRLWSRLSCGSRAQNRFGALQPLTLLTVCYAVLAGFALGQGTGALQGTVEDPSGQIVVGANVKLRNQTTGQEFSTSSDEEGGFRFRGLALGEYMLVVTNQGFKPTELPVSVGERNDNLIRILLKVAIDVESVRVSANDVTIPVASQNTDVIELDRRWMENLPSKEADPLAVPSLFLNPAAAGTLGPMILVDGIESSGLEVPLTSIKRILVNKSPYSAEFARPGRGRIEVFTRKGNLHDYHGNVTFLARNSVLDARNAFADVRPPSQREIAEAELDGPLGPRARLLLAGRYFTSDDSSVVHAHTPTGLLVENVDVPGHNTRLFGRFEFDLTPKHTLTLIYKFKNKSQHNEGIRSFDLPERATDFSIHESEVKVFERAIFSPQFLNDLRLSYKDEPQQTTSVSNQQAIIVLGAFNSGGAQITQQLEEKAAAIQDVATVGWGKQTITFGGGARPRFFHVTDNSNSLGTFTFASLAAYSAGQPELFTMNQGNPRISFAQREYYTFVQDEVQVRPSFSLSLGLRYEWQSNVDYRKNLAPRVAFAYAPGRGPTVLRGGFGIFYDRQPDIIQQQAVLYDGVQGHQIVLNNPGYPLPFDPASPPPASLLRIAPGILTPYLMQASIGIERKFGSGKSLFAMDYTTTRGLRLYRTRDINAPLPNTGAIPDPNFGNIDQFESSGRSRSNSLTASLQTALGNRVNLLAQYTFSKSMDDTSGYAALPANNYDLGPEYGRSDYDRRHRFNLIGTWHIHKGFRAGTVVNLSSGIPFNITTGYLNNGDLMPTARPLGIGRNTGIGPGYASVDFHLAKRFNFRRAEAQNSNAAPAARLRPTGRILAGLSGGGGGEDRVSQLEIAIDAFNAFNHSNFKNYVGTQTSPSFGYANAANPPRQVQLTAKYHF